jgi:hypothetical protein
VGFPQSSATFFGSTPTKKINNYIVLNFSFFVRRVQLWDEALRFMRFQDPAWLGWEPLVIAGHYHIDADKIVGATK